MNIDRKPSRLAAGERETLMTLWQYQRESVVRKVEGLDTQTASKRLVTSDTTLLWLLRHLIRAESLWILGRFAGHHEQVPPEDAPAGDTVEAAVGDYRACWARVDAVIARHDLEDLATQLR